MEEKFIPTEGDTNNDLIDLSYDGYSVGFSVSMDADISSRGSADYDDYVDTKDKFRVFFFDEYGRFLFGAVDRTVTPLGLDDFGRKKFFVRIPLNYIVDRDGNVFDIDAIKRQLREHPFKVAILANWPNEGKSSGSDYEGDENSETIESGVTVVKGEPHWGWADSYLNPESTSVRNINDLHHLVADGNYSNSDRSETRPTRAEVYDFITDAQYQMGVKTDWVKSRQFESREEVETYIRTQWDPSTDKMNAEQLEGRPHYTNLRYLWNFAAAVDYKTITNKSGWKYSDFNNYFDSGDPFVEAWVKRNVQTLSSKLVTVTTEEKTNYVDAFAIDNDEAKLEYFPIDGAEIYSNGTYSGLKLPIGSASYHEDRDDELSGVLRFTAKATGTVRITASAPDGNAALIIEKKRKDTNAKSSTKRYWTSGQNGVMLTWDISVDSNEEFVNIYCINNKDKDIEYNNPIVVNKIEFLKSKYVYDTDREGILPTADNPIPMYGVENFDKLEGHWVEGTTFDLSNVSSSIQTSDTYNKKDIYLIRSLAKVEVYLPKEATYIYMRSMNRTSRCEPMDVETPTSETWHNNPGDLSHSASSSTDCEWFSIKGYGVGFTERPLDSKGQSTEPKDKSQLDSYTDWLSWFYGSWKSAKWNITESNGVVTTSGWDFNTHNTVGNNTTDVTIPSEDSKGKYPHVFNPDINRSDFTSFYYEGSTADGYKYVLYMPDKNIDDPNYPGITSSKPKIAHIEYRLNENHNSNLDDEYCYRIYFADTQPSSGIDWNKYDQDFEQKIHENNSAYGLWPVMRNHIYSFYVSESGGASPTTLVVRVRVTDWGYHRIENNLW